MATSTISLHALATARRESGPMAFDLAPSATAVEPLTVGSPALQAVLDELFGPALDRTGWSLAVRDALAGGRFDHAVALCDAELRNHPTSGLARFLRGAARLESGSYGLAIADFTRAIAADLRFARLTEALGWPRSSARATTNTTSSSPRDFM